MQRATLGDIANSCRQAGIAGPRPVTARNLAPAVTARADLFLSIPSVC